jgi:hypothetical protein
LKNVPLCPRASGIVPVCWTCRNLFNCA